MRLLKYSLVCWMLAAAVCEAQERRPPGPKPDGAQLRPVPNDVR